MAEHLIERQGLVLVVVDIQGPLFDTMAGKDRLLKNALKIIEFAQLLSIPIVLTEQYPQGLGPTRPEIIERLGPIDPIPKLSFGCFGDETFCERLRELGAKT
ncbi:MAG: isochorismatase family protein, partial [Alphaproteobacteria bacterium]